MKALSSLASAIVLCGMSQVTYAQAFPENASALPAAELNQRFAGKTFNVKLADGGSWHVEYKSNGGFSMKTNSGFSDTGDWKTEDGKICSKGRKIGSSCNDVRVLNNDIYLKRDSGEIVQFIVE